MTDYWTEKGLTGRSRNGLFNAGILTLEDLARHTTESLTAIPNLGAKHVHEIVLAAARNGVHVPPAAIKNRCPCCGQVLRAAPRTD